MVNVLESSFSSGLNIPIHKAEHKKHTRNGGFEPVPILYAKTEKIKSTKYKVIFVITFDNELNKTGLKNDIFSNIGIKITKHNPTKINVLKKLPSIVAVFFAFTFLIKCVILIIDIN